MGDEKRGGWRGRSGPSQKLYDRPSGEDKGTILLSSATIPGSSLRETPRLTRCNNIFLCLDRTIGLLIYVVLHLTVLPILAVSLPRTEARVSGNTVVSCVTFYRSVPLSSDYTILFRGMKNGYNFN